VRSAGRPGSAEGPGPRWSWLADRAGAPPPQDAAAGVAPGDLDESRLEQLVGVHSSKASYYAQWRGTRRDLERALTALRSLSEALCVTSLGPVALCDAVLDALGRLFDAEWAALVLVDQELPSAVPPHFTWRRAPGGGTSPPSPEEAASLAARLTGPTAVPAGQQGGDGAARTAVLAAPMRLDYRQVGTLLVGMAHPGGQDAIGVSILETVANQIVVALRNAWLYEHSEEMRRRAVDGWAEAERRADELTRRNVQLRRARGSLARARQAELVSAERHRIARDLHDGVAQCLVGIGMHLEWCHRHQDPASAVYGRLVTSKELARSALERIRMAVHELSQLERPGTGLGQAMRDLAVDFRLAGPLHVSVRVHGRQRQLPLDVEHSLFQICQEGLWNVVRHARAGRAWVELRYHPYETLLSIADDGRGDPAALSRHLSATVRSRDRHGLRNIGERAAELGGEVRVERRRGGGVRIRVRVPDAGAIPGPDADSGVPAAGVAAP
jgi:signal transduction histidine kinase